MQVRVLSRAPTPDGETTMVDAAGLDPAESLNSHVGSTPTPGTMKSKNFDTTNSDSMKCAGDVGDHETCTRSKCKCGCHIEPWPFEHAAVAPTVEQFHGKEEVSGSNPDSGSL